MHRLPQIWWAKAMRNILSFLSVAALAALVGCGGGSNTVSTPSGPSGGNNVGFSTGSVKGNYVFSASGVYSSGNSFATAGVFTADGDGNVTAGVRDIYSDGGQKVQEESVTGTYNLTTDGRGQVTLKGSSGTAVYRFVMRSATEATFFQFSPSADTTGRFLLQSTVTSTALNGPATYVVRLDGEDSSTAPYGAVGALTITGSSVTGTVDQNDSGTFSAQLAASGSVASTPDTYGRGSMTLSIGGTSHTYDYYWVSSNEIELICTDGTLVYGYADLQQPSNAGTFAGGEVFSLSGYSATSGSTLAILETGLVTLDGAGTVTSGVEDYNVGGAYTGNASFGGSYVVPSSGRWTATVTAQATNMVGWQISSSQSVVLTYNSAGTLLETGTLRAQTSGLTTAGISGNYAVDVSGYSFDDPGDVESTASYSADGLGALTGTMDSQTPGYYNTNVAETGQYAISSTGRSTTTIAGAPFVLYAVDGTQGYLISSDPNRMYQGRMVQQPVQ
jgi:hypothetical protein